MRRRVRMATRLMLSAVALGMAGGGSALAQGEARVARPGTPVMACTAMAGVRFPAVEILGAEAQPAGSFRHNAAELYLPDHCRITGVMERRIGVAGKPYGIRFELRLPSAWNGRFLFQGGGGTNGVVLPAIGLVKGPPALAAGFAVISQDSGHAGQDASFGEDQQARIDFLYRSYDRVTTLGKALVDMFYGRPADRSYFMGCSEGGREGLLAAQRMPMEYDGIVSGNPGLMLGASVEGLWNRRAFLRAAPVGPDGRRDLSRTFSASDLKLVHDLVVATCDARDGLADGLIEDWPACRINYAPIMCNGVKSDTCLSRVQIHALREIHEGGNDYRGVKAAEGFPYDTGIGQPHWRSWDLSAQAPAKGEITVMQGLFSSPFDPAYYPGEQLDYDFDKERKAWTETGSLYRTDATTYSTFAGRGGKLLIYTGVSDPVFSATELANYYKRVVRDNGGAEKAASFVRFFAVPGMGHCAGGRALDEFDPLSAVVRWAERGEAPDRLIATGRSFPGRSRPLCPFPQQARFIGKGSSETYRNFTCLEENQTQDSSIKARR